MRMRFEAGNVLDALPPPRGPKDVYLLSAVLHGFDDEACVRALENNVQPNRSCRIALGDRLNSNGSLYKMPITPELSIPDVIALLSQCDLPVEDISSSSPPQFFGVRDNGALVAVIGLEIHPPVGLLRSLAVAPSFRGRCLGAELVAYAESFAAAQGIEELFLLTTTAERFFVKLGYRQASRSIAPTAIKATPQFTGLCPASAAFLSKSLVGAG